ncbi:hypothetical protein [Actinoplanes aureus]|uniref:Tetratricopeptide repeat protein n=1 Tax=Actinoplanes aureus TaxID=2792083 RepID=A0A931C9I3_9ACTN|nr:hypothetical protein [Actinoplanes aureus]MBG0565944.1 hypothetical protein [Actinoplanes aureus]
MTEIDNVMVEMGRAVEQGRAGDRAGARAALEALWDSVGADGDALHRCSIAHYCADLQDAVADELEWDRRALAAVTDLTDERARRFQESLQVRAFLPSLHLNLADGYRRSGETDRARHHLGLAMDQADALPADEYGAWLRNALDRVRAALDAGSRAVLAGPVPA